MIKITFEDKEKRNTNPILIKAKNFSEATNKVAGILDLEAFNFIKGPHKRSSEKKYMYPGVFVSSSENLNEFIHMMNIINRQLESFYDLNEISSPRKYFTVIIENDTLLEYLQNAEGKKNEH